MGDLRVLKFNHDPPVEVDFLSRNQPLRTALTAILAPTGAQLFGDRFWTFEGSKRSLAVAHAIAKLIVGTALVYPATRDLNIEAHTRAGTAPKRAEGLQKVTYLAMALPIGVANTSHLPDLRQELLVDTIIHEVNGDLDALNPLYRLPLAPSASKQPDSDV